MSLSPLTALGRWRAVEGMVEITVPLALAGGAWVGAYRLFSAPTAARGLTTAELAVGLGCCAALTGWMASRQMYLAGRRGPWSQLLLTAIYLAVALFVLPGAVAARFAERCASELDGQVVAAASLADGSLLGAAGGGGALCQVGGVPDNPYLPGALLRPAWSGALSTGVVALLFGLAGLSALGLRDRRVRPSQLGNRLFARLRFAPALGHAAGAGPPPPANGRVVACANPTQWGEHCGQIYSADRKFSPDEACVRCGQAFRPAERLLQLKVVSLFTADVDVLNGLERTDTVSWTRGDPMSPDARISGAERWVLLGQVALPDVITVATALAIVHALLPGMASAEDPRKAEAAALALRRASRVSAWLWFGAVSHRLTYARPTDKVRLAIGPTRLADLVPDGGEELWLQLDVGLLPVELRTGFRKRYADEGRRPELQNSKADLWIPTAPPRPPRGEQGRWVPRIEGDALRAWLSTERSRDDSALGVSVPLPYLPYEKPEEGEAPAPDPFAEASPRPGSLDYARVPLRRDGLEPTGERRTGDLISEWAWMEWEQIELLRQECLVFVTRGGRP